MYIKLNWRSLLSLKIPVIIAFVVIWNSGFIYAMNLSGIFLPEKFSPAGLKIASLTCLSACFFSLCVATIKPFQEIVIAPSRAKNFSVKEFYFLAFISGILALSQLIFPVLWTNPNPL